MPLMPTALFALILAALSLSGCAAVQTSGQPTEIALRGSLHYSTDFSRADGWREYLRDDLSLRVADGAYRAALSSGQYVWGVRPSGAQSDVILSVQTAVTDVEGRGSNGYGLVCRADPGGSGDGYFFLIGTDGSYSIRRGQNGQVDALIPWTRSTALPGADPGGNQVQAVCVGDYLALYVNDRFVAETRDSLYRAGDSGVALVAVPGDALHVDFDNFAVYGGRLVGDGG